MGSFPSLGGPEPHVSLLCVESARPDLCARAALVIREVPGHNRPEATAQKCVMRIQRDLLQLHGSRNGT
jgi:hypothetical protein